jgi:hypothetical protein
LGNRARKTTDRLRVDTWCDRMVRLTRQWNGRQVAIPRDRVTGITVRSLGPVVIVVTGHHDRLNLTALWRLYPRR